MNFSARLQALGARARRQVKLFVCLTLALVAMVIIGLATFGGYVLFGEHYTLDYVVVPGETVTVVSVMENHMTTSLFTRTAKNDPRLLIRKGNGWERSFPLSVACANLQVGDKLVMNRFGRFEYVTKPLPIGEQQAAMLGSYGMPEKKNNSSKEKVASADGATSVLYER